MKTSRGTDSARHSDCARTFILASPGHHGLPGGSPTRTLLSAGRLGGERGETRVASDESTRSTVVFAIFLLRVSPRVAPLTPHSPPPRVPSSQVAITDNDAWTEEIEKVKGATLVVDVHQNWTGPCVAAQGTLRKIAFDHGDKPLKFFTADASRLTALHDYSGPCEPLFMVIKDDNRVEIKGVDAPKLRAAILEKLGVAE